MFLIVYAICKNVLTYDFGMLISAYEHQWKDILMPITPPSLSRRLEFSSIVLRLETLVEVEFILLCSSYFIFYSIWYFQARSVNYVYI